MIHWNETHNITHRNTFGLESIAARYVAIEDERDLDQMPSLDTRFPLMVLGGGSNMILPPTLERSVVSFTKSAIEVLSEDSVKVRLKVYGGCEWHALVKWTVERTLWGIENLALIPGWVGAAPVQNIGAYGVEIKDVLQKVHCYNLESRTHQTLLTSQCNFGYRESIFKNELKDKVLIYAIEIELQKQAQPQTEYGKLKETLARYALEDVRPLDVFRAVCDIRSEKLPDPKVIGNCGSFFKNPVISTSEFNSLQAQYPDIAHYPIDEKKVKVPTAWLLEKAGLKGVRHNGIGTYYKQPLVLVNHQGTYSDLTSFVDYVQTTIFSKFAIQIEQEVNIF